MIGLELQLRLCVARFKKELRAARATKLREIIIEEASAHLVTIDCIIIKCQEPIPPHNTNPDEESLRCLGWCILLQKYVISASRPIARGAAQPVVSWSHIATSSSIDNALVIRSQVRER